MDRIESQRKIERIRELVQIHGVARTSEIVGVTQSYVCQVKARRVGRSQITINSLKLRRVDGKLCRRCGDPAKLIAKSNLCLVCEILDLAQKGVIVVLPNEES